MGSKAGGEARSNGLGTSVKSTSLQVPLAQPRLATVIDQSALSQSRAAGGAAARPALGLEARAHSGSGGRICADGRFAVAVRAASQADALDSWWLRARFAWTQRQADLEPPASTSTASTSAKKSAGFSGSNSNRPLGATPIVLAVVDDRCTQEWTEPQIFWGPRFASALDHMTRDGARVIGMDWIQSNSLRSVVSGKGARQEAARELFESYDQRLGKAPGARSLGCPGQGVN